jgi:hypothetical protein
MFHILTDLDSVSANLATATGDGGAAGDVASGYVSIPDASEVGQARAAAGARASESEGPAPAQYRSK